MLEAIAKIEAYQKIMQKVSLDADDKLEGMKMMVSDNEACDDAVFMEKM